MTGIIRIAWKLPAIVLALIGLALSLAIVREARWRYIVVQYQLKGIGWILGFQIHAQLQDKPSETRFVIANHISYLDIFLIGSLFPTRFLAKAEVSRWFFLGFIARLGETVFVRRDCMRSRYRALKAMARSSQRMCTTIFPEGTTSANRTPSPQHWHRGHAFLGREASKGLYAVGIHYQDQEETAWIDDQALLPHLFRMLARKRIVVFIRGELIMTLNSSPLSMTPALTFEKLRELSLGAADLSELFHKNRSIPPKPWLKPIYEAFFH